MTDIRFVGMMVAQNSSRHPAVALQRNAAVAHRST
jgi:hypothetical protein